MDKKQRLLVNLDPEVKTWLDQTAAEEGVSQSEVVREALASYRARQAPDLDRIDALLQGTRGTWQGEDGLLHQRRLREEWNRDQ